MRLLEGIVLTLLLTVAACAHQPRPIPSPILEHQWTVTGFMEPESAVIDTVRQYIYVTNVNGYALDGNGFVSRVSMDGNETELQWITGVNSPTGIALQNGKLYFADVDALVITDAVSGAILSRVSAPDADQQPVLNDVAITDDGRVFVTGSRSRTIYELVDGALRPWVVDAEGLQNANGLAQDGTHLVAGGKFWLAFDLRSGKAAEPRVSAPHTLADFDGITSDGNTGFLVTLIDDDRIWQLTSEGAAPLSEDSWQGIDLDRAGSTLAVPRVGGKLSLFHLN